MYGLKLNEPTFLPNALYSTPHVNSKSSNRLHLLPSYIQVYILNLVDYLVCCLLLKVPIENISPNVNTYLPVYDMI